ncbi:MAG: GNAT family N-acetyltransferase [Desulfuromonadaceae bacterium]
MNDLDVTRLSPADSSALSLLLTADCNDYSRYFIPFAADTKSLEERLGSVREDRYWGIWFDSNLVGLFMMRGFDEGYQRPSFGVYIACAFSGKGLSKFALYYSMNWCRMNNIGAMMLKVHPDNIYAKQTYTKAGFTVIDTCPRTGHSIMEKTWGKA